MKKSEATVMKKTEKERRRVEEEVEK